MGARLITRRNPRAARGKEVRTLVAIFAATLVPLIIAYILVAADMRSDLSELRALSPASTAGEIFAGWGDLKAAPDSYGSSTRVHVIGYMMDTSHPVRDGTPVMTFVLMPEAGRLFHPAHRVPDEMAEVRLNRAVPFKYRDLVWVSGSLDHGMSAPDNGEASWILRDARSRPAAPREITLWFRP